jgi:hypothetical protein
LTPSQAIAGQGTPAVFTARLVNTGNSIEQFVLGVEAPPEFSAELATRQIEVPPGLENYREVALAVTPPLGTPAATIPVLLRATNHLTQGQATASIRVLDLGVRLAFAPSSSPPGSSFTLSVTNTGLAPQTFDLTLGGSAAPAASLSTSTLDLAPGEQRALSVAVSNVDYAHPGNLPLIALATARGNSAIQARATASVTIVGTRGVWAAFDPAQVRLPGPTRGVALLVVRNSGNTEDAFGARITKVAGPLVASLQDLQSQPSQQSPTFRLPGLAAGMIPLYVDLTHPGAGTVQVTVASLAETNLSALATVVFQGGLILCMSREWIIEMAFTPRPGADHFLEYRESLDPASAGWLPLPGGPYNRGLYYLTLPNQAGAVTPDVTDTNRLFLECAREFSRFYRLQGTPAAPPAVQMRLFTVQALKFDPMPGFDHTIQYSDQLGRTEPEWIDLPRAPHNHGLAFDPLTHAQRFYRVLIQPRTSP